MINRRSWVAEFSSPVVAVIRMPSYLFLRLADEPTWRDYVVASGLPGFVTVAGPRG